MLWAKPSTRLAIAKRIIEIAGAGERDPDKLCQQALAAFGIERTD